MKIAVLAAAVLMLAFAVGCRPTDTLTTVLYSDTATEIDYDSPMKNLKNVPDKAQTTSLPKIYETESEEVDEDTPEPVFDEEADPEQSQETAPKTEYKEESKKKNDNKEGKKETPKEDPKEDSKKERPGTKQTQVGGNEVGKDASKDATEEPDKTGSIIAFGEIANMVCLLGGKGALWAADDEFLTAAKSLYKSGTVADVKKGYWSTYASSGKTISNKKFNKLCDYLESLDDDKRPSYLIYDGSVGCPINSDQAEMLSNDFGITTKYFFLNTDATIKNALNYIRKILQKDFEYDASERYDQYCEFHDKLLSEVNGGKLACANWGDCASANMNYKDGGTVKGSQRMENDQTLWTLVIDGWDKGARYKYNSIDAKNGLGYSTLGYSWSPVSYYLQCAGVINNAAARWQASGNNFNNKTVYHRYVWQMGAYFGSTRKYITSGLLTKETDLISNNSDGDILLRAQSGAFGLGKKAGEGRFPAVIVANKDAKEAMLADRDSGCGAYTPYYLEAGATGNNPNDPAMGLAYKSGGDSKAGLWISYIGRESGGIDERTVDSCIASEKYKNPEKSYDVLVNPCGYYSNWMNGSVESFLQSAWAYQEIYCKYHEGASELNTSYGNSAEEIVRTFYEKFYGGECSDSRASKILSGGFAD